MLCFVKISVSDCDEYNKVMDQLVDRDWTNREDQTDFGMGSDCIGIAANTNPNNSRGRVHVDEVMAWADDEGYDACAVEKDHADHPSRNELSQCAGSGGYYYRHELRESPEGRVCEEYFDDNYMTAECGCIISNDDSTYGEGYCESCYEDHCEENGVQEFDGRNKSFDPASSFGSSRYFGLELETDCGRVSESFAFDGKDDGSIDGTEFVSHKLRGDAGLNECRDFMRSGSGVQVSNACGFHLHADMSDMSDRELYAVFAAYAVCENEWRGMVSSGRNGNSYCRRLEGHIFYDIIEADAFGTDFSEFADNRDRYYWMNVSAYTKHSTFENRLHEGTWEYCTVKGWVVTNLRFIEAARKLRFFAGETVESFKAKAMECLAYAKNTEYAAAVA